MWTHVTDALGSAQLAQTPMAWHNWHNCHGTVGTLGFEGIIGIYGFGVTEAAATAQWAHTILALVHVLRTTY